MSFDTTRANQAAARFEDRDELWLFGYGSLIYKSGFEYIRRQPATITGWARRFWQGSHDHRGTPESPGRVVTLVEAPGAECMGMAYRITPAVFGHLDHREKNGYLRFSTPMRFDDGQVEDGLVYIATADNAAWLGEASVDEMARQIQRSTGPSGRNRDYLLNLDRALRDLHACDDHVFAIAARLRELITAE